MPMVWNAEADAKLLAGVIKIHDLKVNFQALAEFMGPECTPKALTHRIANIKKKAGEGGSTNSPATPSTSRARAPTISTPRAPKSTKATPKSGTKHKAPRGGDEDEAESSGADDEEALGKMNNFDDVESGDDAGQAVDRTPLRRSVSARPGRFAGMDGDEEEETTLRGSKRVKVEREH